MRPNCRVLRKCPEVQRGRNTNGLQRRARGNGRPAAEAPRDHRSAYTRCFPRRSAREVHQRGICASRLWRSSAADRSGADDLAALHRRTDDRGRGHNGRRQGARGRRGLRICRGNHRPDRWPSHRDRTPARAGRGRERRGSAASATTMSRSSRATGPRAGPAKRRSMRSLPPRAAPMSRRRCSSSSPKAGASSCPSARPDGLSSWSR